MYNGGQLAPCISLFSDWTRDFLGKPIQLIVLEPFSADKSTEKLDADQKWIQFVSSDDKKKKRITFLYAV